MGKEDKGLLEDLLGDSMDVGSEQTTKTMEIPMKKPKAKPSLEEQLAGDMGGDDPLMSELVQRKSSGGNKRLIVLSVIFVIIGLIGAGFKFGFIPYAQLARPKISTPKKPPFVAANKAKKANPVEPASPAAPAANPNVAAAPAQNPMLPAANPPAKQAPSLPEPVVAKSAPSLPEPVVQSKPNKTLPTTAKTEPVVEKAKEPESKPIVEKSVAQKKNEIKTAALEKPLREEKPQSLPVASAPSQRGEGGSYSIQIGSYLFASSLKQPMQKLAKMGFKPKVSHGKHKVSLHRVLVGNFRTKEVASGALKDLAEEGIKGQITKKKNGYFAVLTGSFIQQPQAEKMSKRLEEFGYDVTLDKAPVSKKMQELKVGSYPSREAAQIDLDRLKQGGFEPVIVSR